MEKKKRLNVLLAKTEYGNVQFKAIMKEYAKFFSKNQGDFRGQRKTYNPQGDYADMPEERDFTMVVTTVPEKLEYLQETVNDHVSGLFDQEATNSSGSAKAELIVGGVNFGTLSSMELLRLKSILESSDLANMYENLPVRSDSELWEKSNDEVYSSRSIYQTKIQETVKKTTEKESYILPDPNIDKLSDGSRYTPQVAVKSRMEIVGKGTYQKFSGELSQHEKAFILRRRAILLKAVIEALKIANEAEVTKSEMTGDKLFSYLHSGKI